MTSKVPLQLKNLLGDPLSTSSSSLTNIGNTNSISGTSGTFNTIYVSGGYIDGTIIGQSVPAEASFTKVTIDNQPNGGILDVFGSNGSSFRWDPTGGNVNISGGVNVSGISQFGNLRIIGNNLQAVNTGGDVILVPNNQSGKVKISGSLEQISQGTINLDQATSFSLTSSAGVSLSSISDTRISSQGDINLRTDSGRYTISISTTTIGNETTATSTTPHGFLVGDSIVLSGSPYIITSIPSLTSFTVNSVVTATTASKSLTGSINLSAGKGVFVDTDIPVFFGSNSSIIGSTDNLIISSENIISKDPIPTLTNLSSSFSDTGIAIKYLDSTGALKTGFFGFMGSTSSFNFVPDATITYNSITNTKTVSGLRGNLGPGGSQGSIIYGDPNITLSAPNGNIIIPARTPVLLGNTSITGDSGVLRLSSQIINLNASSSICIPLQTRLSFDNCLGNLYITGQTSNTLSLVAPIVSIQTGSQFQLGSGQSMSSNNSNTIISSSGNIFLSPTLSVVIPTAVKLQLGSTSDFLIGGGNQVGITIASSGTLTLNSAGNVIISPRSLIAILNASSILLPSVSQFSWGSGSALLGVSGSNFSMTNTLGNVNISSTNLNLRASGIITVPLNIPIVFGGISSIYQDLTTFHITAPTTVINSAVTINGNFVINGTSTSIQSTVSTYSDPLITLSSTPPFGDIKNKGFEFGWYDGSFRKWGFLGYDPILKSFKLIDDGTNTNEVYSGSYGNLLVGNITAAGVSASSLTIGTIQGNPDLILSCGVLYLNATQSCRLPLGVPFISGANSIVASPTGWSISGPNVAIVGGSLSIGSARLFLSNNNNFHISGVQNTFIDTSLFVTSGILGIGISGSISLDSTTSILTIASGGSTRFSDLVQFGAGTIMGNASTFWTTDIPGGRLVFQNTSTTTPLNVSIYGNILNANWNGNVITLPYGGTGHTGSWEQGSVVFVGQQGNFLDEDNSNFYYDHGLSSLGLQTNTPSSTLSIGAGNIDLFSDNGMILFKSTNLYSWGIGKNGSGFALYTNSVPVSNPALLRPMIFFNKFGQVGINKDVSLAGGAGASLFVGGGGISISANAPLGWSVTEFITSANIGILDLYAQTSIKFHAPAVFSQGLSTTNVTSTASLTLTAPNGIILDTIHTLTENRLCLHHSGSSCQMYQLHNGLNWEMHNTVGDILLSPTSNVIINDNCSLMIGTSAGVFTPSSGGVTFSSLGSLYLSCTTNITDGNVLSFGTAGGLGLSGGTLTIAPGASIPIAFTSLKYMSLPDNIKLQFGDVSRSVYSDGDALHITSHDLIRLDANNVFISGNLRISGTTDLVISSETHFDSGVITLGAGNELMITGLVNFSSSSTLVTTGIAHNLVIGDNVTLEGTVPKIDGAYIVTSVPSLTSFVIQIPFPGRQAGTIVTGTIRTLLTSDYRRDLGAQLDWYQGSNLGTSGSRFGFLGFDRATTRLKYIPVATYISGVYSGAYGDFEIGNIYSTGISCPVLLGPLNGGSFQLSTSNISVTGGTINSTPIGNTVPSTGSFTNLYTDTLTVGSSAPVSNLNSEYVGGYRASDIVLRNGSNSLTANWLAGNFRITTAGISDTTLLATGVVFANTNGVLTTNSGFMFSSNTLTIANLGSTNVNGTLMFNGNSITGALITSSNIQNTNMVLSVGNTLDISQGTLIVGNGQISGNAISGGIANTSITGNSATVTNGVYTTKYIANSILKADVTGTPVSLVVPEGTIIGRKVGGVITALTQTDLDSMFHFTSGGMDTSAYIKKTGGAVDGAMSGILVISNERVTLSTNTSSVISSSVDMTYITVTLSTISPTATVSLGPGISDGQTKTIFISSLPNNCMVQVNLSLAAVWDPTVENAPPSSLLLEYQYQSVELAWDNVIQRWFVRGSGARAI